MEDTGPDADAQLPAARCPGTPVCARRFGHRDGGQPWLVGPLAVVGASPDDVILTNGISRYVIRGADKGAAMYGTTGGHLVDVGHLRKRPFARQTETTRGAAGYVSPTMPGVVVEVLNQDNKPISRCDVNKTGDFSCRVPETARRVSSGRLGLLARGIFITATGTSDCHGTSDFVGNPRTWVYLGEAAAKNLCKGGATVVDEALKSGRAVASAGPMLNVEVSRGKSSAAVGELLSPPSTGSNAATIEVRIAAPEWLPLGTLDVYAGQKEVKSEDVSKAVVKDGAREVVLTLPMEATQSDTTVVAVHVPKAGTNGWPGIHRPAWALTNPVRIDGDGDGKWFGQP
ncbi:MAG: hypothetical protein KC502_19345 [Myxococcales bacterium]|nr:hypothetical protein [Myxococcales bacterium]